MGVSKDNQVFIELSFLGRLRHWDTDSQIEVDVLQHLLRRFGLDALSVPSVAVIERVLTRGDGSTHVVDFWFKLRGAWTFFSLEVREPHVFILMDRARR